MIYRGWESSCAAWMAMTSASSMVCGLMPCVCWIWASALIRSRRRAARRLPLAPARELFAQVVRVWQYAAYAGRLPAQAEFEALLDAASVQWEWRR